MKSKTKSFLTTLLYIGVITTISCSSRPTPQSYFENYVTQSIPNEIYDFKGGRWTGFKAPVSVTFSFEGNFERFSFLNQWKKNEDYDLEEYLRIEGLTERINETKLTKDIIDEALKEWGRLRDKYEKGTCLGLGIKAALNTKIEPTIAYQAYLNHAQREKNESSNFKFILIDNENKRGMLFIPGD